MTFNCSTCGEEMTGEPKSECCGQKVCYKCNARLRGLCAVCDKDILNSAQECDICGREGNGFTIQRCCLDECTWLVCGECTRPEAFGNGVVWCSWRHFKEDTALILEQHPEVLNGHQELVRQVVLDA